MANPRVELHQVTEELEDIEQQLQQLLERQHQLLQRQKRLQRALQEEEQQGEDLNDVQVNFDKTDFPWSTELADKCSSSFGIRSFRPLQLKTMNTTLTGKDCILVMPTGGGKSLCFQLPALLSKGITLVVSPLISLMEDQLYSLRQLGIAAELLNASSTKEKVNSVQAAMTDKKAELKLLYVTPEKLAKSKRFMNKLEKMYEVGRFSRLVIDEVHCCSQWGHDFRPDYKFLGIMKKQFPGVPILGLTATATATVMDDVKKILAIKDCLVYKASFNRHNLYYEVKVKPSGLQASVDHMYNLIRTRFKGQSGIVYCFSQKDTEEVARELTARGVTASCYHASLETTYRSRVHTQWITNKIQVVVATIAFGMGIDKPDVRFVIHHSLSKSMENYYQESGRAGRDDQQAHCILYASFQDVFRQSTMVFTEQTGLEKLYNMVQYAYSLNQCRRSLIARHFGETWDEAQCQEMCDHCNQGQQGETVMKDMSEHSRNVIATLHKHKGKTRLTGLKLMDAWLGKGANSRLSRGEAERLLIYMLLEGYIREDFHFTAYTTISYLVTGPKEYMLQRPGHKVDVPYQAKSKTNSAANQKTEFSKSATKNGISRYSSKVKSASSGSVVDRNHVPCVISTNSLISSSSQFVSESQSSQEVKSTESRKSKAKKKKRVIMSDDSDSDLDFGEVIATKKKQKSSKGIAEERKTVHALTSTNEETGFGSSNCMENGIQSACITLDSD